MSEEQRPTIVCLCGSTRFAEVFNRVGEAETLAGHIIVRPEVVTYSSDRDPQKVAPGVKTMLDELHKRKIDLADEVLVLNVNGYIGDSTRSEVAYAIAHGKPVRWLEPYKIPTPFNVLLEEEMVSTTGQVVKGRTNDQS